MSTDSGDKLIAAEAVAQSMALIEAERAADPEQLDMLGAVSPEEMLEAREELGPRAGNLSVLRHAREKKRGRPKGARNKRSDDFARYILSFGQHPAVTMMEIQSTPPEVLVENSRRLRRRRRTSSGVEVDVMQTMSYEAAQSLRLRAAEGLMPYIESKKPVAVDLSFSGVADMIIEGVTHTREEIADAIDAEFAEVDDPALQPPAGEDIEA